MRTAPVENQEMNATIARIREIDHPLTAKELACLLHVGQVTIYDWCDWGAIPHARLNRCTVRFDPGEIAEWLERRFKRPTEATLSKWLESRGVELTPEQLAAVWKAVAEVLENDSVGRPLGVHE